MVMFFSSEAGKRDRSRKHHHLTPVGDVDHVHGDLAAHFRGQEAAGDEGHAAGAALPVGDLRAFERPVVRSPAVSVAGLGAGDEGRVVLRDIRRGPVSWTAVVCRQNHQRCAAAGSVKKRKGENLRTRRLTVVPHAASLDQVRNVAEAGVPIASHASVCAQTRAHRASADRKPAAAERGVVHQRRS